MLTLADLGVLRDVEVDGDAVVVAITPTYSGCPAMATMRDDLVRTLQEAGFDDVRVRVALDPAWTTDWITPGGRAALAAAGISPPGPVSTGATTRGPVRTPADPDPPGGALPALRVRRRTPHLGVRVDRLQGDVPVPRVPRALRPREGDLSVPPARRRRRPAADRRRSGGDVRRAGRRSRSCSGSRPASRSPCGASSTASSTGAPTRSARRSAARRASAYARSPAASSRAGSCTRCGRGTGSTCCRRAGSFRADPARAAGTCASPPAPASPRCSPSPPRCLLNPGARVTLLYGNRRRRR